MLPSLLFICLYGLNASLLQCHHIYFIPGIAPVIFNLVWTAAVLMLMQMPETRAMPYLAASIILASLGQWLFTWPKSHAVIGNYPADTSSNKGDLWKIGTPMLLGTLGVAATQINNFMDAVFARFASLDGPAFLWYAVRLEQLPLALFGIALSGAVLPPLARAYKSGNMKQYQDFIDYALKRTTLLLIPISFAMVLLGSTGISIIYARGDFGIDSIAGTSACLFAYAIGLWPMGMVQILAPAFYARGNYRKPTQASIIVMALNIVLNGWFVFGLGWSATSIALATSLSAWVNMILLGFGLIRRDAISRPWALSGKIAWVALASVAGAALVLLLDNHALSPLPVQAITLLGKDLFSRSFFLIKNAFIFAAGTGCVLILAKLKN
jgi:putative peptidoglycan lipid II flippase